MDDHRPGIEVINTQPDYIDFTLFSPLFLTQIIDYVKLNPMKNLFMHAGHRYAVGSIGYRHAAAMRDFYVGLAKPFYFSGYVEGRDHTDIATWEEILSQCDEMDVQNFAIFNGGKIIGAGGVAFKEVEGKKVAVFSGSQIADEYLGKGFANYLYDARLKYLQEMNFSGPLETYIKPGNTRSIRAAERNGFFNTGIPYPPHPDHNIFEYRGDALRRTPAPAPEV
jgi:RimJ/RimL family protein N-acetyltransferase